MAGGTVNAWGGCTFGDENSNYSPTYSGSNGFGIGGNAGCNTDRTISITGGTVEARGYKGGIATDCYSHSDAGTGAVTISITGGLVNTVSGTGYNCYAGIGGNHHANDAPRTITLGGNAVVGLWTSTSKTGMAALGGGDNANSTISLQDNAQLINASAIGSTAHVGDYPNEVGAAGGTIKILDNACIGEMNAYGNVDTRSGMYYGHIGGANAYTAGGAGGDITINTTGYLVVQSIGGGSAQDGSANAVTGGNGGNIKIINGDLYVNHLGGGNGRNNGSGEGIGGDGGTSTISGGELDDWTNSPRSEE